MTTTAGSTSTTHAWSGLAAANMIGPSFYAGFLDIGFLPDQTRARLLQDARHLVTAGPSRLRRLFSAVTPGQKGSRRATSEVLQTTFLTMQRKIFEDQALMHGPIEGGLEAIAALGLAGIIDSATVRAWEQI